MADTFSPEKRSEIMSKIKSEKNKSTELKLIDYFKEKGIKGWRRHYKLYGKPDFVFPKEKAAVFTDGCFWHGHDCRRGSKPKDNAAYWEKKIERNQERDRKVRAYLERRGYVVVRIWECEMKDPLVLQSKFYFLL